MMTTYLEFAGRGKNAWWRYAASFALAMVLSVALAMVLIVPLVLMHLWRSDFTQAAQNPAHPLSFFLFNGAAFLVVLAAFAAAIALVHKKRFGDIIGAWRWRAFGMGFGIWAVVLVVTTLLDVLIAPKGFHVAATAQTPVLALVAGLALLVQTFTEEFIFRGYATQGLLLAARRIAPTAILSGLLFGALHIPNGAPQAANAVVFGIVLSVIAIRTGGIAFTFGLHLANNLFGAVVVASSGDAFHGAPALFSQNTPQLMWSDTAVGALALVAVAFVVLRWPQIAQARG